MGRGKLRKAINKVKDRTSISLAKVGSSALLADLEVAIVKSTRHDEYPADEKHIREIITLTSYTRSFIGPAVTSIARRLNKTRNWIVALKAVMLIHRLLVDGDPAFEQEIFFATRRGTRILNLSDFRDYSHSNAYDYSAFVRSYALYLDQRLELRMLSKRGRRSVYGVEVEDGEKLAMASRYGVMPVRDMRTEDMLSWMQRLQQLLDRFLACQPIGAAVNNRIVSVALYPVVKESFNMYYDLTEIMGMLIDRFMELEVADCVKVYDMFSRSLKQFDELDTFYSWTKTCGIARSSEYPEVEKISTKNLSIMVDCITERSDAARTYALDEPEPRREEAREEEVDAVNLMPLLPPLEGDGEEAEAKIEPEVEPERAENRQEIGDLLNLGDDAVSGEDHSDQLALALFDTGASSAGPQWEAFTFSEDAADWETELVQSASNLSSQKATLGGGFDALLLDSMYQQGATLAAMRNVEASGSASSVALGSAGRPAMLALPAPPVAEGGASTVTDPFAASVSVAPPSYVQMSDLEKKRQLLAEEQRLWELYARNGMGGQALLAKLQANPPLAPPSYPGPYRSC